MLLLSLLELAFGQLFFNHMRAYLRISLGLLLVLAEGQALTKPREA